MAVYAEIHSAHQGKSSDKWESYFPVYERLFSPIRHTEINVLEIGVQNGGSLEVLSQYFDKAAHVVGSDINPLCGDLKFADPRISVVIGDINAPDVISTLTNKLKPIHLLIDDGSHVSFEIINAFLNYFPLVAPGGIYVIEDTHCLYWEELGGGILRSTSAQRLFKLLTDVLNYEHWRKGMTLESWLSGFFLKGGVPVFIAEGWVESIEFLNSMIVIHKARQGTHSKLGSRVVAGSEFSVEKTPDSFDVYTH
jgi:FtsJ-like methyltransferase